jgi:ribosome-associated translation inhibitor RaiA
LQRCSIIGQVNILPLNISNQEVIISRVDVHLTDLLKSVIHDQVHKLLNHDNKIIRIRVILEMSQNNAYQDEFIAHG